MTYNNQGSKRPGSGKVSRPVEATKMAKIPVSVDRDTVLAIPDLQIILDKWESECNANRGGARYALLKQMIDEIRALGF